MSGHRVPPSPSTRFYSATKYAVTALCEGWRQELRGYSNLLKITQIYSNILKFTQFYSTLLKLAQIGLGNDCQIRVAQLSPGLVETEFTEVMTKDKTKTEELYKSLECLQSEDMADCIKYILEAHPRMQIHDILVRPTQQKF